MIELALQPVANQSFTAQLDGARYAFTFKEANGTMCADVSRDGDVLVTGLRVVANVPLLPYPYMQDGGNFILYADNDELTYYTGFGVTQFLYYVSADEIATLKGA